MLQSFSRGSFGNARLAASPAIEEDPTDETWKAAFARIRIGDSARPACDSLQANMISPHFIDSFSKGQVLPESEF
jgi:hypothetical protein